LTLVLDCSVTLAWLFEDEQTPALTDLLARVRNEGAYVPSLWSLEVANGLQIALRRGRINIARRDQSLNALEDLRIMIDSNTHAVAWYSTLALSDNHRLTIYDAAYLELALRERLPLATLDNALRTAGTALGMEILPPPP